MNTIKINNGTEEAFAPPFELPSKTDKMKTKKILYSSRRVWRKLGDLLVSGGPGTGFTYKQKPAK